MAWDPYLASLMERYRFSIVTLRGLSNNSSPWQAGNGSQTFDSGGRWREVALVMRRDLTCEHCAEDFNYTFEVVEEGQSHRGRHTQSFTALTRALEKELQRAVHCPHCNRRQQEARKALRKREMKHNTVAVLTIGGGTLGSISLLSIGYMLFDVWGLLGGSVLAGALVLKLTSWMLAQLLDTA